MKRTGWIKAASMTLALGGAMFLATSSFALDRTAEEILKDYNSVKMPAVDAAKYREDAAYRAEYLKARAEAMNTQYELIGELFASHPDHDQLVELLPKRWAGLMNSNADAVKAEIETVLKARSNQKLVVEAHYAVASMTMGEELRKRDDADIDRVLAATDQFIKAAPDDARAPRLLMQIAGTVSDDKKALPIYERIVKEFGETSSAKYAPGKIKQIKGIDKPFELEFTDAITGTQIDMKMLRGKVVVIDFWATWCGPCIAEMPKMKKLYAEYKDQGVEFIGISLDVAEDKGGLTKLREYCEKEDVTWPQYYQGNYWDGEFSVSWGINSIPQLFIIDKEGNLHSVKARGKLETLIPELLAKD